MACTLEIKGKRREVEVLPFDIKTKMGSFCISKGIFSPFLFHVICKYKRSMELLRTFMVVATLKLTFLLRKAAPSNVVKHVVNSLSFELPHHELFYVWEQ